MTCCILLDISSVFCKKIILRILAIIFVRFGFFKVFQAFFLHVLRYQYETWYIHAVGGVTRQVRVSFQSGHFDLTQPKIGQSHLSAFMARFGTYTYVVSVLILTDFRHGCAIFGPLADKNTWKGVLLELPASEKFSGLFCTCCEISVWNLAYTSSGDGATRQVRVSFQSGHFDLLYCQK